MSNEDVRLKVLEKVKEIIGDEIGMDVSNIDPNHSLCMDLAMDELDFLEVCFALEDEFRIYQNLDYELTYNFSSSNEPTVNDLVNLIIKLKEQ